MSDDWEDEHIVFFPPNRCILIGDCGVGKTSLLTRFAENKFNEEYIASIGVDLFVKEIITNNTRDKLTMWDTSGQERFRNICSSNYRGMEICVLVFDITNYQSFENIDKIWRKEYMQANGHQNGKNFPYLLLGNKYDIIANIHYFSTLIESKQRLFMCGYYRILCGDHYIPNDVIDICHSYAIDESKRKVSKDEAMEYAKKYDMLYFEVSALNGLQVMDAFLAILNRKKEIDGKPLVTITTKATNDNYTLLEVSPHNNKKDCCSIL